MADKEQDDHSRQPVGRPLKYQSVVELDAAIDAYFNVCDPHVAKRMVEVGTKTDGEAMFGLRDVMTEQKPYTVGTAPSSVDSLTCPKVPIHLQQAMCRVRGQLRDCTVPAEA